MEYRSHVGWTERVRRRSKRMLVYIPPWPDLVSVPDLILVSVPDLIRAVIASSIPPRKTVWGTAYLQFVPCPGMCGDRN